jgi:hypothetical protein
MSASALTLGSLLPQGRGDGWFGTGSRLNFHSRSVTRREALLSPLRHRQMLQIETNNRIEDWRFILLSYEDACS